MSKKEDNEFYDILGVPRTATTAQIRKGYYNQARIWHPDKNPDDPTSEERFKKISQAYQVLSDGNLREVYDQHGEAGLKAKMEGGGGMQLADVLDALFGGGAFEPVFGSVATLAVVQDLTNGASEENSGPEDPAKASERRAKQQSDEVKICQELAQRLLERLKTASDAAAFKRDCIEFANELCDAPGGIELLQMVSYAYIQTAKQHSDQFFARVGASLAGKGHKVSTLFSIGKHLLGARKAAMKLEKEQKEQEEERRKSLELQQKKRIMDYLSAQRSEGQPFLCMRCKAVMLAPLNLQRGAFVTCSSCNGTQPLAPLFPPLDNWTCSTCTLINEGGTKCSGCESVRPLKAAPHAAAPHVPPYSAVPHAVPPVVAPSSMPPPYASMVSPVLPPSAAPAAAEEWTCNTCTVRNPLNLAECSVCGAKRQVPFALPVAAGSVVAASSVASAIPTAAPVATLIKIPSIPPPMDFELGDTVQINGLVNRPELNGQLGSVIELPDGKEKTRCMVKLMDMEDSVLSFKPENLTKAADEKGTPQQAALQSKLATEGLTLAWKTGKMFLEDRVRRVLETCLTMELPAAEAAHKDQKNKRVQALQQMGHYYQETATAFKAKLVKEGKEEQNLLKGLAQMAAGGADAEAAAKAAAQATAAAAAASARREAAQERKAASPLASDQDNANNRRKSSVPVNESRGSDDRGGGRGSDDRGKRGSADRGARRGSAADPVTIHPAPPDLVPGVDDTD